MEYIIIVKWDSEVNKWTANNDILPLSVEAESLEDLRDIVVSMANEMAGLNNLPEVESIQFILEDAGEIVESTPLK